MTRSARRDAPPHLRPRCVQATTYGEGLTVSLNGTSSWYATFYPPVGGTLGIGQYTGAQRPYYDRLPGNPGLEISGPGSHCFTITGRFTVLELVIVGGAVQRFAADFEQYCEGSAAPLTGSVRFNSRVPLVAGVPISAPHIAALEILPGNTVTLDGSRSLDPDGGALTYAWQQVSGPPVTIVSPNAAIASFVAPAVPMGGADLVFQLTVTNPTGEPGSAQVTAHVLNTADLRTLLHYVSPPGDPEGAGRTRTFRPADGNFVAYPMSGNAVWIRFDNFGSPPPAQTMWWDAYFVAPLNAPITPGVYLNAEDAFSQSPLLPGLGFNLNVDSSGNYCAAPSGRFTVYESVVVNGEVQRFAADFEQRCGPTLPPLTAKLRYNTSVPLVPPYPMASALGPRGVDEGATATLDGNGSHDPGGTALTYAWTQVSGPAVTLATPNAASTSFIAPAVAAGGANVAFDLTVTNAGGIPSTARVTVHVNDIADPKSFLRFESEAGDPVGGGRTRMLTTEDGLFSVQLSGSPDTLLVQFNGSEYYDVRFSAPVGYALIPGDYPLAFSSPASPLHAGLGFSGEGVGYCGQSSGRFVIWEKEVVNNVVTKFAADFEQHCQGLTPGLRGSVRYNTTVALLPPQPLASAIAQRFVEPGATVALDGRASRDPNGSVLTYQWTQVGGVPVSIAADALAQASFTAPAVGPGGSDLVLELRVTNGSALSSVTRVTVHVWHDAEPRSLLYLDGEPGEYITSGGGQFLYTLGEGSFRMYGYQNTANFTFDAGSYGFFAELAAPYGKALTPGVYTFVGRYPSATQPTFNFGGNSRYCSTGTGRFVVYEHVVENYTTTRFAADFEYRCEGTGPLLKGSIRFNSAVSRLPVDPWADTIPNPFAFDGATGIAPGAVVQSNAITVDGITAPAPISVAGGSYSIGCTSTFTTAPATIANGQTVCVRHTTVLAFQSLTSTALDIGGVAGVFQSVTSGPVVGIDTDGDGMLDTVEIAEGRNPFLRDNDVMGSARLFAMQQYRDFLGREGDPGGIQFYTDGINGGALSRAQAIENFFTSPEFSGSVSPIVRLYFATFLRIPDYPGLMFQVNAFRSGTPLDVIATNFTASPEFQVRYGALDDRAFVALLYQNILGRTASAPEIDFHVGRLTAGETRGTVLVGFSESPEYRQLSYIDVYVTMMYAGMLRRAPEPAGFDFWVDYMEGGNPGLALIQGFLNAPEYRNRFQ